MKCTWTAALRVLLARAVAAVNIRLRFERNGVHK